MFGGDALPFNRHSDVLNAFATDRESLARLVDELKRRGNTAFAQKSFDEADALYSKAIELIDSNSSSNDDAFATQHIFYANRSAARAAMGKLQPALADADACVALAPSYVKGYFRRAQALHKLQRFRDALAALQHAQTLEPANKSVVALLAQVEALAKQQKDAPPVAATAPPAEPKRVTRVDVVQPAAANAGTTSKAEPIAVDDDDERIVGAVRGYKKLADGRVTTFFNNELSDEAKQLIGDIAPKKVDDVDAVQIKSVDGGSAWNVGNTFEERDMTAWATSKLTTLFDGVSTPLADGNGIVSAGAIRDLKGDASIAVVRGAKRFIFDFAFTLACSLTCENGDRIDGELRCLDVSSDSGNDLDAEAIVPSRYTSAGGKALHAVLAAPASPFRAALQLRLAQFVREYHSC